MHLMFHREHLHIYVLERDQTIINEDESLINLTTSQKGFEIIIFFLSLFKIILFEEER